MVLTQSARAVAVCWLVSLLLASSYSYAASGEEAELTQVISDLDTKVFDAYNSCDMEAFANYFAEDVEFYHDQGGVTWDRESVVANTRKFICNKVRRALLPGTLHAYPIKDFGALAEGEHQFCQVGSTKCEGIAKFVMIWKKTDDRWVVTRVLSYGHRPSP
jgi:ketosteroid isomerase-like protein